MDSHIASINEHVRLKLSVSRKLQILDPNPKIEFDRLREYSMFRELQEARPPKQVTSPVDEAKRRRELRSRFCMSVIAVAAKLQRFKLKPHEVVSHGLFVRAPYAMGR